MLPPLTGSGCGNRPFDKGVACGVVVQVAELTPQNEWLNSQVEGRFHMTMPVL